MRGLKSTFALCIVVTLGGYLSCDSAKINTPRVLLPWFENLQVNFTFEISEDGCYSWSLSRDDIIDLEPIYEDSYGHCSRSARVSVSKNCAPPGTVIILAEEINTGEILRGDVDIDAVKSLKVMSTTWNLFLEEAPEAFEVVAYDDQGNKFSTLEGVSFKWTVQNLGKTVDEEPLVTLVRWRDTDYEPPRGVTDLESQGLRSYTSLLYGQAIGDSRVTVCLGDDVCTEFDLQVVASVVLTPAVASVAKGDTLRYRVVRVRAGRLTIEQIQDSVYHLHLPQTNIANIEDGVSLVRGTEFGPTVVQLMSGVTEVASATLNVVEPHGIRIKIRPADLVVKGEMFTIHCIVVDKSGHPLTSGDATLVRLSARGAAIDLISSTDNGTITDAVAYEAGTFTVTARLHSINGRQLSHKVESEATGISVEPLRVVPEELFVAWTDSILEIPLQHSGGGDEEVTWGESETQQAQNALSLSHDGSLTVRGEGDLSVRVQLKKYGFVQAFGRVWSVLPEYLQLTSSGQARVNNPHYMYISLTGTHPLTGELYNFHVCDCSTITLLHTEGPEPLNVTAVKHVPPIEGACCVLSVSFPQAGVSALLARRGRISGTALVGVLDSPRIHWPPGDVASIVGGTLPVLATGEALKPSTSEPRVSSLLARDSTRPIRYPDMQLFTLTCHKKGDSTVKLESQVSWEMEAAVSTVHCAATVSRLRLDPPAQCPNTRLWLHPNQEARIKVTMFDAVGRELLDETGPPASWEFTPKHQGLEVKSSDRLLVETLDEYYPVPVPFKFYQVIKADEQALGWSGTVKVTVADATTSIQARVVAPITCEPMRVDLALEEVESDVISVQVTGGSGRYSVSSRGAGGSLDVTIKDGGVRLRPLQTGNYDLLITDDCLHDATVVEVNVEEMLTVEVHTSRALCVNACVPLTAVARGISGRELQTSNPPLFSVSGNVEVRGDQLCGIKEGRGGVTAKLGSVSSREVEVLVFPPLSIIPSSLTLAPTARIQLERSGGPPDNIATFSYSLVEPSDAVDVSTWGAVGAQSVGRGRVRLVALDLLRVEVASAEAFIEVVPLSSLSIITPTKTVEVGSPLPMYLSAPRLSPAALASLWPQPKPVWTLRDPSVGVLYVGHVFDGLQRSTVEGISVRFVPKKPGPVVIDVKVRNIGHLIDSSVFESHIEVLAVQPLTVHLEGSTEQWPSSELRVAVGSTVRLKPSPRAACSYTGEGFEVSAGCEVRARSVARGALRLHGTDDNNIYRETIIHLYSAVPRFATVEPSIEDPEFAVRLVMRDDLCRPLLSPQANVSVVPRLDVAHTKYTAYGPEFALPTSDSETFVSCSGDVGNISVTDYVLLPPGYSGDRIIAPSGSVICLPEGLYTAPPALRPRPVGGVTVLVLGGDPNSRDTHTLHGDRGPVVIHQLPVEQLSFQETSSGGLTVPLRFHPTVSNVWCPDGLRASLSGHSLDVPWTCRVSRPHRATGTVDFIHGTVGCTIIPTTEILEPTEVELCAEWGRHRTCTKTTIYPAISLDNTKLSLLNPPATFSIHGHASVLQDVNLIPSPGILIDKKVLKGEIKVSVSSDDMSCGSGYVVVDSVKSDQHLRVDVAKECDAACGSLLGAILSMLWPHCTTIVTAVGVAAASYYVLTRQAKPPPINVWSPPGGPPSPSLVSPSHPAAAVSPSSPRAPRRSPRPPPVYGDASQLPDQSFSPNSTLHSRFL